MEIKGNNHSARSWRIILFSCLITTAYSLSKRDRYPREYYNWEQRHFIEIAINNKPGAEQNQHLNKKQKEARRVTNKMGCSKNMVLCGFVTPKEKLIARKAIGEMNRVLIDCNINPMEIVGEKWDFYKEEKEHNDWDNGAWMKSPYETYFSKHCAYFYKIHGVLSPGGWCVRDNSHISHSRLIVAVGDRRYELDRVITFRHEYLHMLGLGHTELNSESIMSVRMSQETSPWEYRDDDKLMIEMLYNRYISSGTTEAGLANPYHLHYIRRPDRRSRGMRLRYPVLYDKDLTDWMEEKEQKTRDLVSKADYKKYHEKYYINYLKNEALEVELAKTYRP